MGNVLKSVNVSAILVSDLARKSKAAGLGRVVALLRKHEHDIGEFITADPRGKHVPAHLGHLAEHLKTEQAAIVKELDALRSNIEHIKDIVAMQQSYAKVAGVHSDHSWEDMLETLVELSTDALQRSNARLADADEPGRRAPLRNLLGQGQGLCRACCQGAGRRLKVRNPIRADRMP